MQRQSSVARNPARPVWMIEQPTYQRPCFSRIAAFKQCRGLHAAVEDVRFMWVAERYLPDVFQRKAGVARKSNGGLTRISPALSKIVAGTQHGAPVTLGGRPDTVLATTAVISQCINRVPVEIGPSDVPTSTLRVRAQKESSFFRSHQQEKISLSDVNILHIVQPGISF